MFSRDCCDFCGAGSVSFEGAGSTGFILAAVACGAGSGFRGDSLATGEAGAGVSVADFFFAAFFFALGAAFFLVVAVLVLAFALVARFFFAGAFFVGGDVGSPLTAAVEPTVFAADFVPVVSSGI